MDTNFFPFLFLGVIGVDFFFALSLHLTSYMLESKNFASLLLGI
jgi:hypothetical protein